jgi:energy-coupling factor transporter transmembrane protein EcfT
MVRDPRAFLISVFLFVAWIVAATGWVRFVAVIWLACPAFAVARVHRRRRDRGT